MNQKEIIEVLFFPIQGSIMFPKITKNFKISNSLMKKRIDEVYDSDKKLIFLVAENIHDVENSKRYFYPIGTIGEILAVYKDGDDYIVEVKGLWRARQLDLINKKMAKVEILVDEPTTFSTQELLTLKNYTKRLKFLLKELQELIPKVFNFIKIQNWLSVDSEEIERIESFLDLEPILYNFIFESDFFKIAEKQELLMIDNVILRSVKIFSLLLEIYSFLKAQEQLIKRDDSESQEKGELLVGNKYDGQEYKRLYKKYQEIKNIISEEIDHVIKEDLNRLKVSHSESVESAQIIAHLEFLLDFPWGKYTQDPKEFNQVKLNLDSDHYGLEHIKERIIEFLAVKRLNPNSRGSILCFVGPPGVGKTSLGQSIARSLNRKFIRISLGGVSDEAEIRGHRRTYVGALPGKIIQEIKRCGSLNPVFMIDEVDKIGRELHKGDPSSALLEALDPEQNFAFRDNYVGAGIDLSKVLFITTANVLDTIQKPLLDRMEIIRLPGYTEFEKIQIAKKFLVPKQLKESGLVNKITIDFSENVLLFIIKNYTDEAGVRELERKIAAILRRIAKEYLLRTSVKVVVNERFVEEILGSKIYSDNKSRETPIGVAVGLAYTPNGGRILFIESARFISNQEKRLSQTGILGDVFKESIKISLTILRSKYFADPNLDSYVFHVHVPEGAVPKDGPSAGITIFTSLFSLIHQKPVKPHLAMTGEITLEGRVLPVGAIREKVVAAFSAGVKEVILPEGNRGDILDIPDEIRDKLKIHFVENIDQVIKIAFNNNKGE